MCVGGWLHRSGNRIRRRRGTTAFAHGGPDLVSAPTGLAIDPGTLAAIWVIISQCLLCTPVPNGV